MTAMSTIQTGIRLPSHRQPTQHTRQQWLATRQTRRCPCDFHTNQALGDEFHAPTHIDWRRQVFEDFRTRHQQLPAIQYVGVGFLVAVVQVLLRIAQQRTTEIAEIARQSTVVVQRIRIRIAAMLFQLMGQGQRRPRFVGRCVEWQNRVVR
jgi:hypothetical protein